MIPAPIPADETRRLAALQGLGVLDTPREERFDRICRLAAAHFKVPIALVSLVDRDRQWFKARSGLEVDQTPRDISFCGHAILGTQALVVEDAKEDERFCDNPLVIGEPRVRFYAGQPLVAADGSRIGTLCLIDHVPRTLGADARRALGDFAAMVESELGAAERIRALEANREQEGRFAAIVDAALDCVVSMDEQGAILEFNPAAERTFGYRRDEMIGKNLAQHLIPPRLRAAHENGMSHYKRTGEGPVLGRRVEVTAQRADGSEFPVEMAITPASRDGRKTFTAYLRDISARQESMRRQSLQYGVVRTLAESFSFETAIQQVIRATCESIGWDLGAAWRVDEARSELRLCCLWNSPLLKAGGFVEASHRMSFARGTGLPGRVWKEDRPAWIRDISSDGNFPRARAALEGRLHAAFAFPIRSGSRVMGVMEFFSREIREPDEDLLRMFEAMGSQLGQFAERKADEMRLHQLTAELDAIFNLSPDGFLAFGRDGRKKYANRGFARMFDVRQEELEGLAEGDVDDFLRDRCDPASAYPPIAEAPDGDTGVLRVVRPRRQALKRSVKVLQEGRESPIGKVIYFRDVSIEDEVDRMKSEFLSTAAHELRTPLSSILGFAELLLKREYDATTRQELLATIHRQSTNLGRLIDELLDLARIEARAGKDFRIRPRSLLPLIRQTVGGLKLPGDERKVQMTLPKTSPLVDVDEDKFRQALLNVLSNAYKYSPGGGAIELGTRARAVGNARQFGICIRDHGIGMSFEQCERIFERFYRADNSGAIPGTGLGMSLVKEIVELHGGAVEVKSRQGEGTEVTLWFPIASDDPDRNGNA